MSDERKHFLFTWSCGCPFSVLTEERGMTEHKAWLEAFHGPERAQAAREVGVKMLRITHAEWESEWMARFKADCGHNPPKLPPLSDFDHGSFEIEVDDENEELVKQICALVGEETGSLWLHIGVVVEKLSPGISPFDKREAIAEILRPVKAVFTDAFW